MSLNAYIKGYTFQEIGPNRPFLGPGGKRWFQFTAEGRIVPAKNPNPVAPQAQKSPFAGSSTPSTKVGSEGTSQAEQEAQKQPEQSAEAHIENQSSWLRIESRKEGYTPSDEDTSSVIFSGNSKDYPRPDTPHIYNYFDEKMPQSFVDYFKNVLGKMPDEQLIDLARYVNAPKEYSIWMGKIRENPESFKEAPTNIQKFINSITKSIAEGGTLAQPIYVWRGIGGEEEFDTKGFMTALNAAHESGEDLHMPGFKSSSVNKYDANDGSIIFKIKAKTGLYIAPLGLLDEAQLSPRVVDALDDSRAFLNSEYEWIQGPYVKYRVTNITQDEFGAKNSPKMKHLVELEEI